MRVSIKTVSWVGCFCVGSTLGACGGNVKPGDSAMAGAGGASHAAGGSHAAEGATAGSGSGAGPMNGGASGVGSGGSAQAGTGSGGSAQAGTGSGGSSQAGGGSGGSAEPGAGGAGSVQAGTGGGDTADAGMGGSDSADAGAGGAGSSDSPFAPRTGSFQMLVYWETKGFMHSSIEAGQVMLAEIAAEQGFELAMIDTDEEEITLELLSNYEIVFFLNTSGDIFDDTEQQAFQDWMTTRMGAYAGVHSATDTEANWLFYQEVTGQYHDGHTSVIPGEILIQDSAREFPGMENLPNPWTRNEEWFAFDDHEEWSVKPGFTILARRAANNHPVSWVREHENFRAFSTSLGHESQAYDDDLVKTHIAGGIMWAVRREHLFQE
jgi:type 1 glutamine amidotransferase